MIQRKQTLYLFLSAFMSIALLFIPVYKLGTENGEFSMSLTPLTEPLQSSIGHQAVIIVNFLALTLASLIIFIYKRLSLQVKLCYVLMILWLVVMAMTAFCPMVIETPALKSVHNTYFGTLVAGLGLIVSYMALKFIKRDIELLKSADRVR